MRELLEESFRAAVAAADPLEILAPHLPQPPKGRTFVAAAGKEAASMALAVERNYPGEVQGVAITRYSHALPTMKIRVVEAGHPVPDEAGEAAARNRGLNAAQAELIAFLDADDLWHPEKLARQVSRLCERPEIDLSFTCFHNFWIPELAEEERCYQGSRLSQPQYAWSTSTLLARRAVFAKFGNFSVNGSKAAGSESMIWFLRAAEGGAVIDVLPDVLMYRRMHAANVSRRNPIETFLPILKEWRDHQRRRDNR